MSPRLNKSAKCLSRAPSPYSLFGGFLSNSPPTPFGSQRQRAVGKRRGKKKPLEPAQPISTRTGTIAKKPLIVIDKRGSTHRCEQTTTTTRTAKLNVNSLEVEDEVYDDKVYDDKLYDDKVYDEVRDKVHTGKSRNDMVSAGSDNRSSYASESSDFRLSFDENHTGFARPSASSGVSLRRKSWSNSSRREDLIDTSKTSPASTSVFQVTLGPAKRRSQFTSSFAHDFRNIDPPPENDDSDDASISTCTSTSGFRVSGPKTLQRKPGRRKLSSRSRGKREVESLIDSSQQSNRSSCTVAESVLETSQSSNANASTCSSRSRTLSSMCQSRTNTRNSSLERRRRTLTPLSNLNVTNHRLQVVAERITWLRILPLILPEYPVTFQYIFKNWRLNVVSKLGEGSFSEVYKVRKQSDADDEFDVFKVIPVGKPGQPTFDDMLPEMTMCLAGRCLLESLENRAPSFLSLRGTHLVRGSFTQEMVTAYEAFQSSNPKDTEHPHPLERLSDQFYVAFYTSYDGCEVESTLRTLTGDLRASIILQITYGLAIGELSFEFEHRDLHLSNLVVKDYEESELEFRINYRKFVIKSFGKRAALIDYGMCRLVVDEVLHSPFEPEILVGPGLQRWTYREQHRMLNGDYANRCLQTNGLWIKFLIRKMFTRRPVNSKIYYADQINRLYSALCENHLSAQQCVEILEDCDLSNSIPTT